MYENQRKREIVNIETRKEFPLLRVEVYWPASDGRWTGPFLPMCCLRTSRRQGGCRSSVIHSTYINICIYIRVCTCV